MLDEVLNGLRQYPKSLPSKFFYDERGSQLFEEITQLEEYYPTRTERAIMENHIEEITDFIEDNSVLIELGSGSSKKTRLLLNHLPNLAAYVPVEISEQYLNSVVKELKQEYPKLTIKPVNADYTEPFEIPNLGKSHTHAVFYYPGSTIGNFNPEQARSFLSTISKICESKGGMLIGVDLKKEKDILESAYNDEKGVTAEFNLNVLRHINEKLGADFNLNQFFHRAIYNEKEGRIEMHLVSEAKQKVTIGEEEIKFLEGEIIHTENSYKYSLESFQKLVEPWFTVVKTWTDKNDFFSVQYLERKADEN